MPTANETRTCQRCKGKGFRSTPVAHLGVPGLCYGCNGGGTQKWVTKETINDYRDARWAKHFDEIKRDGVAVKEAAEFYTLFQDWADAEPTTPEARRYARRLRNRLRDANKSLERLRTKWTASKEAERLDKPAARGEWRAA